MKKILTKTNISLLIIALCAVLFCGLFAINNFSAKKVPTTHAESSATLKSGWNMMLGYDIENLIITNKFDTSKAGENIPIDVSEEQNGSLYAYKVDNGNDTYNCVIYADVNKIYAPINSQYLFAGRNSDSSSGAKTSLYNVKTISFENQVFDTSKVTDMYGMFCLLHHVSSLNLSCFNTSNVKICGAMFAGCCILTELNISSFDTSNVENMYGMFTGCAKLPSLTFGPLFNTSNVKNMSQMFHGCFNLQSLDVSKFDTSSVTAMLYMFAGCESLTSLDVSNFDTTNVLDFRYMFTACANLKTLNLSQKNLSNGKKSWDTSTAGAMTAMFAGCFDLEELDLKHFNTSPVEVMDNMFSHYSSNILSQQQVASMSGMDYTDTEFWTKAQQSSFDFVYDEEENNKAYSKKEMAAMGSFIYDGTTRTMKLKKLDISGFVIGTNTNVNTMFDGLTNLQKLVAPAECNKEIALPVTLLEQGMETEYTKISSASNGKTLIIAGYVEEETTTPSTGFVDEQLLPMITIGIFSIMAVMFVSSKKRNSKQISM